MTGFEGLDGVLKLMAGFIGGLLICVFIIAIAVIVFSTICLWKCFEKMGEPGWKALIPFYNMWILCRHAWGNGWMIGTWFIPAIGMSMMHITYWNLFTGFGKSTLLKVAFLFMPIVGLAVCAFDKSTYVDQILI